MSRVILHLDGHRYDALVVAAPLEYLQFLAATGRSPGTGGPSGTEAVLQRDLEWQLESIAAEVHRVVKQGRGHTVCACGVVLHSGDIVPSRGHRDLRTWGPVTQPYVVSHGQDADERFAVVCPGCGLGVTASGLADARPRRSQHDCEDLATLRTPAELALHLGLR